jgi:hypothetical protein
MRSICIVPLRRAFGPLGAMATIGLIAGYLIGHDAMARHAASKPAPSVTTASRRPAGTDSSSAHVTTTDGAAGGRDAKQQAGATAGQLGAQAGYAFLLTQPGGHGPVRWDPCRPLHYKISLAPEVPQPEILEVRSAFAMVGTALGGVTFVYDGMTDVVPDVVDGSAAADTDIVFAFATAGPGPSGSDLLSGWEAGRGGMAAAGVRALDGTVIQRPTHGSVVLDVTKWQVMSRHDREVLYLHEIGHAVGLDHPRDIHQIMSSGAYDLPPRYQPGDLAGFARLGRQAGCTQ